MINLKYKWPLDEPDRFGVLSGTDGVKGVIHLAKTSADGKSTSEHPPLYSSIDTKRGPLECKLSDVPELQDDRTELLDFFKSMVWKCVTTGLYAAGKIATPYVPCKWVRPRIRPNDEWVDLAGGVLHRAMISKESFNPPRITRRINGKLSPWPNIGLKLMNDGTIRALHYSYMNYSLELIEPTGFDYLSYLKELNSRILAPFTIHQNHEEKTEPTP